MGTDKTFGLKPLTLDRKKRRKGPANFARAERNLVSAMLQLAQHTGKVITDIDPATNPEKTPTLVHMLRSYAQTITPWAESIIKRMADDVDGQNRQMWASFGEEMSAALKREIRSAPTGELMRELMAEQVELIRSIPLDAAQRVHDLTIKGLENSTRAADIAREIMRSGEVAKSRAMLIARTEVSRTSALLTQARAEYVGSEGYVWRTSKDGDVRQSHREMSSQFVRWNEPPTLDKMTGHAGCLPNCRCWAEVVLPDETKP